MARPVLVLDLGIVLRALVDIVDHQPDRRARGDLLAIALARMTPDRMRTCVGFLALRREARLARPAAVEVALDLGLAQRDQRRAAVDDAADRRPVALAEGGDAEEMAECVVRHENLGRAGNSRVAAAKQDGCSRERGKKSGSHGIPQPKMGRGN
jgi:hypothetical protein